MKDTESSNSKEDVLWKRMFFGLVIMLAAIAGGSIWLKHARLENFGCDSSTPPVANVDTPPTSATVQPDFTGEQDDNEGYDQKPWGMPIANFAYKGEIPDSLPKFVNLRADLVTENEIQNELGIIFDIPWRDKDAPMSKDFSVVPDNFQTIARGPKSETHYVFYKGQLAYVYLTLNGRSYDAVLEDLKSKYHQTGFQTVDWERASDYGSGFDTTTLTMTVFKRAGTNTQIYLLHQVEDQPEIRMQSQMVHILYIPTADLWAIKHDIENLESQRQANAVAATQPDLQKIQ